MYQIIGKADRYIKENSGNKYLFFTSTDGNNNVLTKFSKLRSQIKHIIQTTNGGKKCKYVRLHEDRI